ncbi:hypothetical protein D3C77_341560 [compost metagenome]
MNPNIMHYYSGKTNVINWITKSGSITVIFSILLLQGCSSGTMDSVMKGYTDAVLGKDYVSGPELAAGLGEYAKILDVCKKQLSPQEYGLYASDVAWYAKYIDNPTEQEAYTKAFNTHIPTSDECKELSYNAEVIHNIRLNHQKESIDFQNRKSQSSHTNCVETYNGLSCNTTPW